MTKQKSIHHSNTGIHLLIMTIITGIINIKVHTSKKERVLREVKYRTNLRSLVYDEWV